MVQLCKFIKEWYNSIRRPLRCIEPVHYVCEYSSRLGYPSFFIKGEGIFTAYVYDDWSCYVNENIMSGKKNWYL